MILIHHSTYLRLENVTQSFSRFVCCILTSDSMVSQCSLNVVCFEMRNDYTFLHQCFLFFFYSFRLFRNHSPLDHYFHSSTLNEYRMQDDERKVVYLLALTPAEQMKWEALQRNASNKGNRFAMKERGFNMKIETHTASWWNGSRTTEGKRINGGSLSSNDCHGKNIKRE